MNRVAIIAVFTSFLILVGSGVVGILLAVALMGLLDLVI